MYLITNGRLITRDPANPYFEDGGVARGGLDHIGGGRRPYP